MRTGVSHGYQIICVSNKNPTRQFHANSWQMLPLLLHAGLMHAGTLFYMACATGVSCGF